MMRDAAIAALEKVTTSGGERLGVHSQLELGAVYVFVVEINPLGACS